MLLLTTEFLIVSLFLFIIITNDQKRYSNYTSFLSLKYFVIIMFVVFFSSCLLSYSNFSHLYKFMYHGIWDIFASDLFIFFYTFFMAFPQFIFFFTLILSLFTIFFILFYFSMRKAAQRTDDSFVGVQVLRKQNRVKQERFSPMVRTFSIKSTGYFEDLNRPSTVAIKRKDEEDKTEKELLRFFKDLCVPKRKFFDT